MPVTFESRVQVIADSDKKHRKMKLLHEALRAVEGLLHNCDLDKFF